ncbi:MAG: carboxymuconolactone decarboxylase family protein [Alcanivorax sp.]|nr:carboxymuconolactone decarboxylase family protein [Alcanivorax sp.]
MKHAQILEPRQQAIVAVAAEAASGQLAPLKAALNRGLDQGLTLNDAREVLVQLYAYAGFPRSLNALGTLMTVREERRQQGIEDTVGDEPNQPIPSGDELLARGTATQTQLAGGPVSGPLFDFAPAIDNYLKTHLFGDIFARDNLSWRDREIATIAMLAALSGVAPQLKAHIAIGRNAGLSRQQLEQVATLLAEQVSADSAGRVRAALAAYQQQ